MDRTFTLFGKIAAALVVVGIIGGGAYYLGKNSSKTMLSTTPTPTATVTATPSAALIPTGEKITPSAEPTATTGAISGSLGYPSEQIPPLFVYAISTDNPSSTFSIKTIANATMFTIPNVSPGNYYVVAYPETNSSYAGSYTNAVACGLSVNCTDHTMIEVEVVAGKIAQGVELRDWYAPEGTFPKKP